MKDLIIFMKLKNFECAITVILDENSFDVSPRLYITSKYTKQFILQSVSIFI